jgi:hypothetical protein
MCFVIASTPTHGKRRRAVGRQGGDRGSWRGNVNGPVQLADEEDVQLRIGLVIPLCTPLIGMSRSGTELQNKVLIRVATDEIKPVHVHRSLNVGASRCMVVDVHCENSEGYTQDRIYETPETHCVFSGGEPSLIGTKAHVVCTEEGINRCSGLPTFRRRSRRPAQVVVGGAL